MKKILLSAAFLFVAFVGANAQQTISFEASEGFTLGDINEQNGWTTTTYSETEGGPTLYIDSQLISDELSSDGTQSLKITEDTNFTTSNNPVFGAFNSNFSTTGEQFEVSYDFYGSILDGADFTFNLYNGNDFTARVNFSYQGVVAVVDLNDAGTGLTYVPTTQTWLAETWYNVKIVFDITDNTVEYYVDETLIYSGVPLSNSFDTIACTHDNWGGFAYYDNIIVSGATASAEDFVTSTFSIYPNPVKDILNISNSIGAEINSLTIVDINGRTVKQINSNISQINISDLNAGVYFVNINSNEGSLTTKIVKQ